MSEPLINKTVPRSNVVDTVADSLRTEILSGAYAPGDYLPPARELAEQYGVNRTSLKHALVRLTQAGLLETRHGIGTRVRDFEREGGIDLLPMLAVANAAGWARAIFEVRTEIGTLIAVRAAAHATPAQRDRLTDLAGRLRSAGDADTAQVTEAEWHRELARASGNRVYPLLMNVVLDTYLRQRRALRGPFLDPAAAADRLTPLCRAVCDGADAATVRAEAARYLDETGALMLAGGTAAEAETEGDRT
ncbi:GntR family transcriptional regulator [Prauserella shujinwangii]|uniref:GntR family transcriptional regulator n=1 Tax=Prauserella shujinwangii TaxID=1453103 RepID=A0A2T0LSH3_9PSEU|nr:GntR family transcriptional regulator [Prauserella shujinwangii]PRX46572.1 GntR family transcriptional regulator [Prauserella shujinwangii]